MKQIFLKLLKSKKQVTILWILLGLIAVIKSINNPQAYNNYLIFKNVFYHLIDQVDIKSLISDSTQKI